MNHKIKIGIVGQGYVGEAIKSGFELHHRNIKYYDKFDSAKSNVESIEQLANFCNIFFICVPTPMQKDGSCDTSIVEEVICDIDKYKSNSSKSNIAIIKSTVTPGTSEKIRNKICNLDIVFNPEFLTEKNFIEDFKNQEHIILGGSQESVNLISSVYKAVFSSAKIIKTDSKTAEMVKYFINTYLATKVAFANEIKIICDSINVDYDKVIEYAISDKRIGNSHLSVPGHDGHFGFGGSCFPKDLNALIELAKSNNIDPILLKSVWDLNLKVRPEQDWKELKGRAVSIDKDR